MIALLSLLFLVFATSAVAAQTPAPPPTCEMQLDEARAVNVQLRKSKAQADFTAAATEEAATVLQKRLAEMEAKTKAAEKK